MSDAAYCQCDAPEIKRVTRARKNRKPGRLHYSDYVRTPEGKGARARFNKQRELGKIAGLLAGLVARREASELLAGTITRPLSEEPSLVRHGASTPMELRVGTHDEIRDSAYGMHHPPEFYLGMPLYEMWARGLTTEGDVPVTGA